MIAHAAERLCAVGALDETQKQTVQPANHWSKGRSRESFRIGQMPVDRNALRRALYLGLGVIAQAQAEMHSLSKRESQIDEPGMVVRHPRICEVIADGKDTTIDRKSTRLNSSH